MENKRLVYMDITKYWAIWLVLLAHTIQYSNMGNDEVWKENTLTRIIISFHMSLFMVISGFFFRSSLKRSLSDLMKQKIVQLLIPCVVFGAISYFSLSIPFSSWFKAIWIFGWYVKCFFLCYLGTWIIYKAADMWGVNPYWLLGICVITMLLFRMPDLWCFPKMYIFFVAGILIREKPTIVSFCLWIIKNKTL